MKKTFKIILITLLATLLAASLAGCSLLGGGNTSEEVGDGGHGVALPDDWDDGNDDVGVVDGNPDVLDDGGEPAELKELEFVLWDVDNNNGIPYFFAKVYNPNSVAVDFTLCVDYSVNGEKHVTDDMNSMAGVAGPGETITLFDLSGSALPDADAIDVRYEYLGVSSYEILDAKVVKNETAADGYSHHIEVEIPEDDFYYCDLRVLYYLDGDVSGFDSATFYPGDTYAYDTSCVFNYDDYEVFVQAVKVP